MGFKSGFWLGHSKRQSETCAEAALGLASISWLYASGHGHAKRLTLSLVSGLMHSAAHLLQGLLCIWLYSYFS